MLISGENNVDLNLLFIVFFTKYSCIHFFFILSLLKIFSVFIFMYNILSIFIYLFEYICQVNITLFVFYLNLFIFQI